MTKTLAFDLEFTNDGVVAISPEGEAAIGDPDSLRLTQREFYARAIDRGLHIRFENATLRDSITRS